MTIVQCRAQNKSVKNRQPRVHRSLFVPAHTPSRLLREFHSDCHRRREVRCLVVFHIRSQLLESTFRDKKGPFHRAVITPKANGASRGIKNSALVREIEHRTRNASGQHLHSNGTIGPLRGLAALRAFSGEHMRGWNTTPIPSLAREVHGGWPLTDDGSMHVSRVISPRFARLTLSFTSF
jgi:hypothetical protein